MGDIKNNVQTLTECRCRPWRQAVWRGFGNPPIPAYIMELERKAVPTPFLVFKSEEKSTYQDTSFEDEKIRAEMYN